MMSKLKMGALVAPLLLAGSLSFAEVSVRVYVPHRPPRAVHEVRIASPGAGYIWIPGYHHWDGNAYVWTGGRWEQPPRARARWTNGRWVHSARHGWYWNEGRWR